MFSFREDNVLVSDREDLLALLHMRFGEIPAGVIERVYGIDRLDMLQRLILIAANADDWRIFVEELLAGDEAFKLTGERFQPAVGIGGETLE